MRPRILMALLCSIAFAKLTNAGELLHLKNGSFDPSKKLQSLSQQDIQTRYYIIQFDKHPTALNYKELNDQGVEWLAYLPDDALIVKLPQGRKIDKLKLTGLRATWPYHSELKVAPGLNLINVFNKNHLTSLSVKIFLRTY